MTRTFTGFIQEVLEPRKKKNAETIYVSQREFDEYKSFLQDQQIAWHPRINGLMYKDKVVVVYPQKELELSTG